MKVCDDTFLVEVLLVHLEKSSKLRVILLCLFVFVIDNLYLINAFTYLTEYTIENREDNKRFILSILFNEVHVVENEAE